MSWDAAACQGEKGEKEHEGHWHEVCPSWPDLRITVSSAVATPGGEGRVGGREAEAAHRAGESVGNKQTEAMSVG